MDKLPAIITQTDSPLDSGTVNAITAVVRGMLNPALESLCETLIRNAEAMERIAAAQQMQGQRLTELEKQVRLQTPVNVKQEKYIGAAIRDRARDLLANRGLAANRKALTKLAAAIRKSVYVRYGIGSLREIPAYDYDTALRQIKIWNDLVITSAIVRDARTETTTNEGQG